MTIPVPLTPTQSPHQTQNQNQHLRRRTQAPHNAIGRSSANNSDSSGSNARLLLALAVACLWPLVWIVLSVIFADASAITNTSASAAGLSDSTNQDMINPGLSFRKYLDRVDIMGYGPTHPRVSVVIVGSADEKGLQDETSKLISTVESVFRYVHLCTRLRNGSTHIRLFMSVI